MTDHEMLNAVFSHTNYHIYVDNEKYMEVVGTKILVLSSTKKEIL